MTTHQLRDTQSTIGRGNLIASYASPGAEIGIPWELWEEYIQALEIKQPRFACEVSWSDHMRGSHRLLAPVRQYAARTAAEVASDSVVFVYPVIK